MNTIRLACLSILLVMVGLLMQVYIHAQDVPTANSHESAEPAPAEPALLPAEVQGPPRVANPSPLHVRIVAVIEAERVAAADLQARIAAATDDEELVALQRELEALKKETRITILQVQADFARDEGRLGQAAEIEAAIETLRNPSRLPERTEDVPGPDKNAGTGR